MVTAELMPWAWRPFTWSSIKATRGEITMVRAPVLSYRDRAGTW